MLFSYEIVCEVQKEYHYEVKKVLYETFRMESMCILVEELETRKFNCFIIMYETQNLEEVIKNSTPLTFIEALDLFPHEGLIRENYGF